eukprot:COSAG01_NODE_768_length_13739_cov_6.271334_25_plen_75_part_00
MLEFARSHVRGIASSHLVRFGDRASGGADASGAAWVKLERKDNRCTPVSGPLRPFVRPFWLEFPYATSVLVTKY